MSTKPEPDDHRVDAAAPSPFGNEEQPWFIRQVRQARLDPNDNVLPMRSPIPKAEAFNWPAASEKPAARDVPSGQRSAPGDADWLAWTPPPMDPVASRPPPRDLRWPLLVGLAVLAVLLAFGAGWLLRDRTVRSDAAVPATAVAAEPAPVVGPARRLEAPRHHARPAAEQTIVQHSVSRPVIETAPPRRVPVVEPLAREAKPHSRPATVAKAPASRAPARVTRAAPLPAVRRQPRAAEFEPRSRRATADSEREAVSEMPTDTRPQRGERDDEVDRSAAPTNEAPSGQFADTEPQVMESDEARWTRREEGRREQDQRRAHRVLPRCVGFQIYRPNVACRVGGPR